MGLKLKNKGEKDTPWDEVEAGDIFLLAHFMAPIESVGTPAIKTQYGRVFWLNTGCPLVESWERYRVVRILQPGELLEVM